MSRTRNQRVNLASIAERLGVSISTVSRSLRGMDGIHPETSARVLGLAHEMGYVIRTEGAAQTASAGLRHVLALSQNTSPHIDQRYMAGMSGAAVSANVAILSHLVAADQCASVLDARLAPASLRAGMVKGVVLLHRWPQEVAAQISRKFPAVSIVHDYPGLPIDLIGIDDRRGISDLLAHLHAGGHRRIGFFGLCPEVTWSSARYGAYVEGLARLGLDYDARDIVRIDLAAALSAADFPSDGWAAQVRARLRAKVDAWVCASATTGHMLQRFLTDEGVRIPEDAAIVSYHGGSHPRSSTLPSITSTDVIDEELGAAAVRRLINRIESPGESRRSILVPAVLVTGATTRPVNEPAAHASAVGA